ncbi:MAG TPA: exosortase A [Stellaceae bacterium]|nr:exosortase A [Stellaceae bacterium]
MVMMQRPGTAALEPPLALKSWVAAGLCVFVAFAGLCAVFPHEIAGAVRVWLGSTAYNHCFLIIPVAIYLAWSRRYVVQETVPQPDLRFLALLLPLVAAWLVAAVVSVMELQQFVVITMFQVIALSVLGWRVYRAMLLPFLYLYFLVPFGYELVPWLQNVTAWFCIEGLKLLGIPVYSDGILIEVPAGTFVVAEACAGLRFLIASIAFGVFFAALMYRSRTRWVIFIALSVVVPVIANGFRALGIISLAEALDSAAAVEADHIIYGWIFFTIVTILLIFIGMSFADDRAEVAAPASGASAAYAAPLPRTSSLFLAAVVGLVLAGAGPAYAVYRDWQGATADLADVAPPPVASPWTPVAANTFGWRPVIQDPDREFLRSFNADGHTVMQYVALYQATGFHNNLVRGVNSVADGTRWQETARGSAKVTAGGRDATVATTIFSGTGRKLLVWDFYVVNDKIVASPMAAKLAQVKALFGRTDRVAAFVAIATDTADDEAASSQRLRQFLAAMEPMQRYLADGAKP